MDKLISQQAAIDTLKELTANGTNKGMVFGEDAVHRIEMMPSVQSEQQWIPCSKRLPEDDTEVLVYLFENNKSPYIAWLSDGRWYTEYFEVEQEDEPVAWMPLPEPYQEGGE